MQKSSGSATLAKVSACRLFNFNYAPLINSIAFNNYKQIRLLQKVCCKNRQNRRTKNQELDAQADNFYRISWQQMEN